jgi:hypothetical protein
LNYQNLIVLNNHMTLIRTNVGMVYRFELSTNIGINVQTC